MNHAGLNQSLEKMLDRVLSHRVVTLPHRYPRLFLMLWVLPLLLVQSAQQSFMAHDEGIYASQAKQILESGDWIRPGEFNYDRTIGLQWIIALCFQVLGQSEGSARLPSVIAALVGVILTYQIGTIVFTPSIAFSGALILAVTPLWAQYSRLATQDMVLVALELLSIWALLQGEHSASHRSRWAGLAGISLGLGFFIKGFMVVPVTIALCPYLILGQRRHRYLTTPGLYLGFCIGLLPLAIWLGLSVQHYGTMPLQGLFGKLFVLSQETFNRNGPLFYFWNIPANSLPWTPFSLVGLGLLLRQIKSGTPGTPGTPKTGNFHSDQFHGSGKFDPLMLDRLWLALGYPGLLFLALLIFKTRTRYYPLQLMPFLALLAAIALDALRHHYQTQNQTQKVAPVELPHGKRFPWIALLSYGCGGFAALLIGAGVLLNLPLFGVSPWGLDASLSPYGQIAIGLGLGWSVVPLSFGWGKVEETQGDTQGDRAVSFLTRSEPISAGLSTRISGQISGQISARSWHSGWLLGPWLAIVLFGLTGVWGDYNPDLKAFLRQPQIMEILEQYPIHQVKATTPLQVNDRKTALLLEFYVPQKGRVVESIEALNPGDYTWLQPSAPTLTSASEAMTYQLLGTVRNWQLIQVQRVQSHDNSWQETGDLTP